MTKPQLGEQGGGPYGHVEVFIEGATSVLSHMQAALPAWIALGEEST
jgi:hypothetical protein